MQVLMDDSGNRPDDILRDLAKMLGSPQIPVQARVAADLGVDQPFVSNARNGRLKRVTPRVRRLIEYATMRVDGAKAGKAAADEIDAEVESVTLGSARLPNSGPRSEGTSPVGGATDARRYDEDALAGVKAYLDDGYDPRLIVEQLAVLRRAQRVRRPGRADQPNRKQPR